MKLLSCLRTALCLLGVLAMPAAAAYPEKPINMIIAFTAGGSSDVQARIMQKYWNKYAPQPWVFVYKPGAGGIIGFTEIAKARPDGSTIGLDPNTGAPRFTFGTYDLLQGVSVIPCMIGLFSFSQVLYLIGTDKTFIAEYHPHKGAFGKVLRYLTTRCKTVLVRSSIIGTWVGMLPGAGGEIASIISYNESKRDGCQTKP